MSSIFFHSRSTTWTLHPNYVNTDVENGNDIAVIDIRGKGLTLSNTIKPVCKPTARPVLNDVLTIMGWGLTEAGTISPVLKRVSIMIYFLFERLANNRPCFQGKTIVRDNDAECALLRFTGICTKPDAAQAEAGLTCGGDSGSSVGAIRDGNFEIDGLVSFGDAPCDLFGAHTPVFEFINWVEANIAGSSWE